MSGSMPACSIANHLPVRPKPVWISSTISTAPRSRQTRCAVLQEVRRADVDAALALDHFEHDRRGLIGDRLVERRRIVELHVRRLEQRPEALAILRLPRHRQRAHRPAVKSLGRGDERRALGEQPRELQRAVHRFGAAVGEKHVRQVLRQHVDQRLRELRALVVVEIVGAERQRFRLLLDRRGHAGMAVTEHRHALRGSEIEILVAAARRRASSLRRG